MLHQPVSLSLTPSRRTFLKLIAGSGGALMVGTTLPVAGAAEGEVPDNFPREPNAFVRIDADNSVTVIVKHLDKGQGIATGLAVIVAEELGADWSQMKTEFAPAEVPRYANRLFGIQATGGSSSVRNSWGELRYAGAALRLMLVQAAAHQWKVPSAEITAEGGRLRHAASGRQATFGSFATQAAKLPVPREVRLKDPRHFTLIGSTRPRRLDSVGKTTGAAKFGLDIRRPEMLRAVIARPPRFGGTVKSFDASAAKAVAGVVDVVQVPAGIAVLAHDSWSAIKGRQALIVEWDDKDAEKRSSSAILTDYKALADKPGLTAARRGDSAAALAGAAKLVEAAYTFPYLAHAPMEPLNAVAEISADGADIWCGSQMQTIDQAVAAGILGLKADRVRIHTTWAGGSFGRRATTSADMVAEAAMIAKAIGGRAPVQVLWTREDDVRGGRYRPAYYHKMRAGLDGAGNVVGWEHRIVGQSILAGTPFEKFMVKDGIDATSVEGAADMPYGVPAVTVDLHTTDSPVSVLWWRSVGHSHTAYAVETFIDDLAQAAGKDPLAFRLSLLGGQPRLSKVLTVAAEQGDWGKPLPAGRGRGLAVAESFGSAVAQVVEVTVGGDGKVKVDRVVCAVDCGIAVTPDQVKAQMEGGIGYGLGAVLRGAITLTDGLVDQANFDRYLPLRMSDMPKIEVTIVPSIAHPSGVGEPGVPPLGPALANAIFAATGKRPRDLPLSSIGMA